MSGKRMKAATAIKIGTGSRGLLWLACLCFGAATAKRLLVVNAILHIWLLSHLYRSCSLTMTVFLDLVIANLDRQLGGQWSW